MLTLEELNEQVNELKNLVKVLQETSNNVYVILCNRRKDKELLPAYISSEGYKTYDEAVNWILSREDKPEPMLKDCNCWSFRSESHYYEIKEIKIKENYER